MAHRLTRPLTALLGSLFALGFLLATAIPVAACDCQGPQPMSAYAGDPSQVVFTGVVMPTDARGVPVQVTHWFQGIEPAAIVWLDAGGFGGDGASCGTALPPASAEWIFVAWRSEDAAELSVNLCTPHAAASDPTGQAMYKDAVATFGEGITPADPSGSGQPDRGRRAVPASACRRRRGLHRGRGRHGDRRGPPTAPGPGRGSGSARTARRCSRRRRYRSSRHPDVTAVPASSASPRRWA